MQSEKMKMTYFISNLFQTQTRHITAASGLQIQFGTTQAGINTGSIADHQCYGFSNIERLGGAGLQQTRNHGRLVVAANLNPRILTERQSQQIFAVADTQPASQWR